MSSRIDTSQPTPSSVGTTAPNASPHQPTPNGLAGTGSSLRTHENAQEGGGLLHWVKETLLGILQTLWNCLSSLFAATTAPAQETTQTPLNRTQTPRTTLSEVAQMRLHQRLSRGVVTLMHHITEETFSRWALDGKAAIIMKYNGQTMIALGSLSEGVETVKSRAAVQLQELLESPANLTCENGRLTIDTFIFKRRNLQLFDYRRLDSVMTFGNRTDSHGGDGMMNNVTEGIILDILCSIIANSSNAADLLNRVREHVFVTNETTSAPAETPETRLNHRIAKGTEMIHQHFARHNLNQVEEPHRTHIFITIKYNNQLSQRSVLGTLSEGRDSLINDATAQLRQLLTCDNQRQCEHGNLSIQMLVFKQMGDGEVSYRQETSMMQFPNAEQSGWNTYHADRLNEASLRQQLQTAIPEFEATTRLIISRVCPQP